MLYKHSFSILCGHLNLNQKRKKLNLAGYHSNRPVTGQTGPVNRSNQSANRWKPVELPFFIWNLNLTGFFGNRSNRSGLPEPEAGCLVGSVGKKNLPWRRVWACHRCKPWRRPEEGRYGQEAHEGSLRARRQGHGVRWVEHFLPFNSGCSNCRCSSVVLDDLYRWN